MFIYIGCRHNYPSSIKTPFCITIWKDWKKAVEWLRLELSKTRPSLSFLYVISRTSQGWMVFGVYTTGEDKICLWRKKAGTVLLARLHIGFSSWSNRYKQGMEPQMHLLDTISFSLNLSFFSGPSFPNSSLPDWEVVSNLTFPFLQP